MGRKQIGVRYFRSTFEGDGHYVDFGKGWSGDFNSTSPSESYWIVPGTCDGDNLPAARPTSGDTNER